jgi:conjugative transfer region protein TrbK
MRALNAKGWGTLAAIAVLAAVVIASLIAAEHRQTAPAAITDGTRSVGELDRCRSLGADAGKDAACQAAWRLLRDHFFGLDGKAARP